MKELNNIDLNNISPRLPQSKSYLKILGIPYFLEDTNLSVMLDIIKRVIKCIHIFNDIVLASYPWVIKTYPKSDMVMIYVDIWDSQDNTKAKCLINRYFNIGWYIATIRGINMNLSIS